MPDLDTLIKNAIDQATETGTVPDPMAGEGESEGGTDDEGAGEADTEGDSSDSGEAGGVEEGSEGTETGDDSDSDSAESGGSDTTEGTEGDGSTDGKGGKDSTAIKSDEQKEFEAILKELGINLPDEKASKNRVPYGRTLRTLVNKVKKERERLSSEHTKVLSKRDEALRTHQQQLENFIAADRLAQEDPERYVALLAALYPDKYGHYASLRRQEPRQSAVDPNDPEPQPDKRDDQNVAYFSPEQWAKREEWSRRQAVREAVEIVRKETEQKYGPLVQRDQVAALQQQQLTLIRGRIQQAKKTYGEDLYKENEDAIAKAINDDDMAAQRERRAPMTFEAIVASILVPKLQERVQKQREIVTEELKKAPAAASSGKSQSTRPRTQKDNDDRPLEEKMADAVNDFKRSHGLR